MKPVPRSAFTDVSGFEAKKHAIRQTTDGLWQLTLTISDFGSADWLVFAPTGLPMAIGIKALDYDNPEIGEGDDDEPLKRYITRAAMLCKNERFQSYMEHRASEEGFYGWGMGQLEEECASALRHFLGLSSRSELAAVHNDAVRDKMDKLVSDFRVHLKQFQT